MQAPPSYLIGSERIKDSVAEVNEKVMKTLGRIPSILEEDFSSQVGLNGESSFRQG